MKRTLLYLTPSKFEAYLIAAMFLAVPLLAQRVSAEVYECNGKWTNKPCSGTITRSLEETGSKAPVDPQVKAVREKTSALHELRMEVIRARDEFGLKYDIGALEKFCLDAATPVDACQSKVNETKADFDQRIAAESAHLAQQRSNELQEESNRLQRERNEIEANRPNVTVIQEERPYIVVPRHHEEITDSGASIHVGAGGSHGSVDIHAGTGTHSGDTPVVIVPDHNVGHGDHGRPDPIPKQSVVVYDHFGNPTKLEGVKPGPFAPQNSPRYSVDGHADDTKKCR